VADQERGAEPEEKKKAFGLNRRNQYIVIAVLGIVFAGLLMYRSVGDGEASAASVQGKPHDGEPQRLTPPPPAPPVPEEPVLPLPGEQLARDPFVVPPVLRKILEKKDHTSNDTQSGDPDLPDPETIKQAQALVLKGIMGNQARRTAFISNKPVRAGGTIGGFTVVEIRQKSVLLRKGTTEVELKLKPPLRTIRRAASGTTGHHGVPEHRSTPNPATGSRK